MRIGPDVVVKIIDMAESMGGDVLGMEINLRYGDGWTKAVVPDAWDLTEIRPNQLPEVADLEQEVINCMRSPRDCIPLRIMAQGMEEIAIVISDHTRTLPSGALLPILCNELGQAGIKKDNITVVIGGGNHRPVTEEERKRLMGPLYGQLRCVHSTETGYRMLGVTKRGTPVAVSTPVAAADLVIGLGSIELHQLAGYSGGAKSVAIGTASKRAIEHNHRLSCLYGTTAGILDGNPVRDDMEEFAGQTKLGFIINVVLNEYKKVIAVVAGAPVAAHRAGCSFAKRLCMVEVDGPSGITIVSPGGTPRDDTVYQAQKAVSNALKMTAKGGIIIVTARCAEGFGDPVFEDWIKGAADLPELEERTRKEFVLGGHKAAFIIKAVKQARVFWVSEMEPADVARLFFTPFSSFQAATDAAVKDRGGQGRVIIMPWGGLTFPVLRGDGEKQWHGDTGETVV